MAIASDAVELSSGDARAFIAAVGAEPVAWTVAGRELLWQADPAVWPRTSPVLFPIVGRARDGVVRVGGRTYPMGIHGFAAESRFEIVGRSRDAVRFELVDNAKTRSHYPFGFRLAAAYRLQDSTLHARFEVVNTGPNPMPYALGLHPGFAWPFASGSRGRYVIEFEAKERPEVPRITAQGLFSDEKRPVPLDGRVLALDDALMSREALCFLDVRSRWVRFASPDGSAIRIDVEDFPHFALWSRPPAPYLCIEAWTGYGDPDDFSGDLSEKPSMRLLAPGGSAEHCIAMGYEAARPEIT